MHNDPNNLKLKEIAAGRMTAIGLRYFEARVVGKKHVRVGTFCLPGQSKQTLEKQALDLGYISEEEAVYNHE